MSEVPIPRDQARGYGDSVGEVRGGVQWEQWTFEIGGDGAGE